MDGLIEAWSGAGRRLGSGRSVGSAVWYFTEQCVVGECQLRRVVWVEDVGPAIVDGCGRVGRGG